MDSQSRHPDYKRCFPLARWANLTSGNGHAQIKQQTFMFNHKFLCSKKIWSPCLFYFYTWKMNLPILFFFFFNYTAFVYLLLFFLAAFLHNSYRLKDRRRRTGLNNVPACASLALSFKASRLEMRRGSLTLCWGTSAMYQCNTQDFCDMANLINNKVHTCSVGWLLWMFTPICVSCRSKWNEKKLNELKLTCHLCTWVQVHWNVFFHIP